jgi:hypothetical protein
MAQDAPEASAESRSASLRRSIERVLGKPFPESEREQPTRYSAVFVDLKDDGNRQAIAYVTGRDWCGTAGCTLLILEPLGVEYRLVGRIPGVRLPISVMATKSSGWHDIAVTVRPNGCEPMYRGMLSFDGKNYPIRTRRLTAKVSSKEVISNTSRSIPLYK